MITRTLPEDSGKPIQNTPNPAQFNAALGTMLRAPLYSSMIEAEDGLHRLASRLNVRVERTPSEETVHTTWKKESVSITLDRALLERVAHFLPERLEAKVKPVHAALRSLLASPHRTTEQERERAKLTTELGRLMKSATRSRTRLLQDLTLLELAIVQAARRDHTGLHVRFTYDKEHGPRARFLAHRVHADTPDQTASSWPRLAKMLGWRLDNTEQRRRMEVGLEVLERAHFTLELKKKGKGKKKDVHSIAHTGLVRDTGEVIWAEGFDGHRAGYWRVWELVPEFAAQVFPTPGADQKHSAFIPVDPAILTMPKAAVPMALYLRSRQVLGQNNPVVHLGTAINYSGVLRSRRQTRTQTRHNFDVALAACSEHLGLYIEHGQLELDDQLELPLEGTSHESVESTGSGTQEAPTSTRRRTRRPARRRTLNARTWLKQHFDSTELLRVLERPKDPESTHAPTTG